MATLADFLRTGKLGRIATGVAKDFVREILGNPQDVSVQKNPEVWKYGVLQLGFFRGRDGGQARLAFIGMYFQRPEDVVPESLGLTGWMPSRKTTPQEICDYLATFNGVTGALRESDGNLVMENSGVVILFDEGKLDRILFTAPAKGHDRQVSVFIPEDTWERIRREAAQRKVTPSSLCAQWIKEKATNLCSTAPSNPPNGH
jgi:hypothetical protein